MINMIYYQAGDKGQLNEMVYLIKGSYDAYDLHGLYSYIPITKEKSVNRETSFT